MRLYGFLGLALKNGRIMKIGKPLRAYFSHCSIDSAKPC